MPSEGFELCPEVLDLLIHGLENRWMEDFRWCVEFAQRVGQDFVESLSELGCERVRVCRRPRERGPFEGVRR